MTTIHQPRGPKVGLWTGDSAESYIDLSDRVIALQVTKDMAAPMGAWSLTLAAQTVDGHRLADPKGLDRLYRMHLLNKVISIGVEHGGGLMLGLVGSVSVRRQRAGRQVSMTLQLSGHDFGKLLQQDQIVKASLTVASAVDYFSKISVTLGSAHPLLVSLPGVWGPASGKDGVPTFLAQSVNDAIDWILVNATSMRIPLLADAMGGAGAAASFIETRYSVASSHADRVFSEGPHSYHGSIWGFVQSVLDPDLYEMWIDTLPADADPGRVWLDPGRPPSVKDIPTPALIIRPRPFDDPALTFAQVSASLSTDWSSTKTLIRQLGQQEVGLHEVFSDSYSYSDTTALSHYQVTTDHELIGNAQAEGMGLAYPLTDTYAVKRFGLRQFRSRLSLVGADFTRLDAGDETYTGEIAAEVRDARNRFFNWYRLNPWFEHAQLTVAGRDDYRPGEKVFLPWRSDYLTGTAGMTYYCTAVTWSWSFGKPYTASLRLERGHNSAMVAAAAGQIIGDANVINPLHFAES